MPMDRTNKQFDCDFPSCGRAFWRPADLQRHKQIHCDYAERQFACPYAGCGFRANQQGGLNCHINSIHENVRLSCYEPGCMITFSDPSSRRKHWRRFHNPEAGHPQYPQSSKRKSQSISLDARVALYVEEHSGQDATDILDQFSTFAVRASGSSNMPSITLDDPPSGPATRPSASHSASPTASSSVVRPNSTGQPPPYERVGVLHRAHDVQIDGWSIDNNSQIEHQAYDANPRAAPTARNYYPDAPLLARPQEPGPSTSQTGHDLTCRCWICFGGPLTLPPLRSQHQEDQVEREGPRPNEAPFPFSYPGMGHVPPSSDHRQRPPNDLPSSAYVRPNPRMLF